MSIAAKARRAAEWWNLQHDLCPVFAKTLWLSREINGKKLDMDDARLITVAENLGWQDTKIDGLYGAIARPSYGGSFVDDGLKHHTFAAKGRALTLVEAADGIEFYMFTGDGADRTYKEGKVSSNEMLADLVRWLEYGEQDAELSIPTEEELPDICARGMAQFMDEIAPKPIQVEDGDRYVNSHIEGNGVEWKTTHECQRFAEDVWLNVYWCYDKKFRWEVFVTGPEHGAKAKGTAPTRAEARRQAVEAARGMGGWAILRGGSDGRAKRTDRDDWESNPENRAR